MKKIVCLTWGLTLAVLLLSVSCKPQPQQESEGTDPQGATISGDYSVTIDAPQELPSGDKVSVFYAKAGTTGFSTNDAYTMPAVGVRAAGVLSTPLLEETRYDWYAIWPYDETYESPEYLPLTIGNQTQNGKDSQAHLKHLLAGARLGVAAATMGPRISMTEVTAVLAIRVFNTGKNAFDVSSIKVKADAPIAGNGAVDLTGGTPVFAATTSSDEITLSVTDGSLERSASAKYYLNVIPSAAKNLTITIGDVSAEVPCEGLLPGATVEVDFSTAEIPHFIPGIEAELDGSDYWHAQLAAPYTLSGEFDLTDLFSRLPSGNITFELGSMVRQNAEVRERFEEISGYLTEGKHWNPTAPLRSTFSQDPDRSGILFVMKQNGTALFNIFLSCVDPIAGKTWKIGDKDHLSIPEIFEDNYAAWGDQFSCPEMEYWQTMNNWESTMLRAGAHEIIHMGELYADYSPVQDAGNADVVPTTPIRYIYQADTQWKAMLTWISRFADFSFKGTDGAEIFKFNGRDLELTEYGKALCHNSAGLYWIPGWTCMYSSCRWNLYPIQEEREALANKEQPNGTYYANLRGESLNINYYDHQAADLRAERGIYIEDGILKTDENYTGIGFFLEPRICFEYDYGTTTYFVGPRYLGRIYFNRYFAPVEASDK